MSELVGVVREPQVTEGKKKGKGNDRPQVTEGKTQKKRNGMPYFAKTQGLSKCRQLQKEKRRQQCTQTGRTRRRSVLVL